MWLTNYLAWILDYCSSRLEICQSDVIVRAKHYVLSNYTDSNLTLGQVAEYVGLSEKYLTNRFTHESGETFSDYLTGVRLQKAKELLKTTSFKVYEIAAGYAIDGKVLGIPMTAGYEYVYYWKDMFQEAGVEVPTTWSEFEEAAKTLQDYYGATDSDFMAIACGLKDEWPDYPYMEFMPALESGNGQNWNTMATQDTPFAEGTDINKAYHKVNELFTSGVLGKDPLGIGNDQATSLFCAKKSSYHCAWRLGLTEHSERH